MCAFIYVRERRLVRDSNLERRLRHVVFGEKPTIHRLKPWMCHKDLVPSLVELLRLLLLPKSINRLKFPQS